MKIVRRVTGELANNTYLLVEGKECVIIDPPVDSAKIISYIANEELKPIAIVLTHGHWDHYWSMKEMQDLYNVEVYGHPADFDMIKRNYSELHHKNLSCSVDVDIIPIEPGNMKLGPFEFYVIHTPGHSPGGICMYFADDKQLIAGDTLFRGTVGRWDFSEGSKPALIKSVQELYKLPDDVEVRPGHGPGTTIGYEKLNNDSVRER